MQTLGRRLWCKYIRNYLLVYPINFTFSAISPKLQGVWRRNFRFAFRKIWAFIWNQKIHYFRLSPGGWECDRHKGPLKKQNVVCAHKFSWFAKKGVCTTYDVLGISALNVCAIFGEITILANLTTANFAAHFH